MPMTIHSHTESYIQLILIHTTESYINIRIYMYTMIVLYIERTLHTDVLFGLVKDISRFRENDFRLIISSKMI